MAYILGVEDDAVLARIFSLNLKRLGHRVEAAMSASEALSLVAATTTPFDLILLDINLPDATGWDLLRWLRERWEAHPASGAVFPKVIVLTALRPLPSYLAAFTPDGVLLKPFPIDALLRLVERVLSKPDKPSVNDHEDPGYLYQTEQLDGQD